MRARQCALVVVLGLAGCANGLPGSYVATGKDVSGQQVAANLTGLVAHALPPAHWTVTIKAPPGKDGKQFAAKFIDAMRARGFGVADHGATLVRYAVTHFDGAVLLRVWTPQEVISRAYRPDSSGQLVPVSPISVGRGE